MCSRYSLTSPPEAVRSYFALDRIEAFPPRYNIAPTQPVAIVRLDHQRRRELALVRWGLIPSWVNDLSKLTLMINARAETAADKPSFRAGMRHRRCLVPADCFYEWMGPAGAKRPYMMRPAAGGPMALAGIWDHWLGPDGSEIDTMAILTVAANPTVGRIHDRMPAILPPEHFDAWLDTSSGLAQAAQALLEPAPEGLLEVLEVSRKLNNSRNEGPEVQEIVGRMLL